MLIRTMLVGTFLFAMTAAAAQADVSHAIDRMLCVTNADAAVRIAHPHDHELTVEAGPYSEKIKSPNRLTVFAAGRQMESYIYYTVTVDLTSVRCPVTSVVLSKRNL